MDRLLFPASSCNLCDWRPFELLSYSVLQPKIRDTSLLHSDDCSKCVPWS